MSRFFGPIFQTAYIVRDFEGTLKHWTEVLGVGPFYYIERVKMDWFRYHGEPSNAEVSIALANTGDLQIELIQQRNNAPSMYLDFLENGHEGLQHMSYWTTDYQAAFDNFIAMGYRVGQEGQIGNGTTESSLTPVKVASGATRISATADDVLIAVAGS